jgi:hypothetical protein
MLAKILAISLYGLIGAVFLVAGVSVLLLGTDLLPDAVRDLIVDDLGQGNVNTLHIMQEFGALLVFAGLITFWFMRHYDASRPFHWALTAFWALFALVHWFHIAGRSGPDLGQVINTIPFGLFVAVGLLREASAARSARAPTD